jgi:hypothetical protein
MTGSPPPNARSHGRAAPDPPSTGDFGRFVTESGHFKDDVLDALAEAANVAQFLSFGPAPDPVLRHVRIHDPPLVGGFHSIEEAIEGLFYRCLDPSVNVRSFLPDQPKSHEFLYGLRTVDEAAASVRRLTSQGLFTIVNETIDVNDGGVSGVIYAGLMEFAPGDTPRCVEKPGTATLPRDLGLDVLETVYGFRPSLDYGDGFRVEFSVHPLKRGVRRDHTVVWEMERTEPLHLAGDVDWPNRFSRFIGDKAFGLLVADAVGLPVPATTVVSRGVAPFRMGQATGSAEAWIRTCPVEQVPGRFTTKRGWIDPFALIATEDPDGVEIASVLAQEGVDARYSGAAVAGARTDIIVEGVAGTGERFMQGTAAPEALPTATVDDVLATYRLVTDRLGPVRFEWAHDGTTTWILQLHRGRTRSTGRVIYPGEPSVEHRFPVENGLEALRMLIATLEGTGEGVVLEGLVGVTSHLGDILRRARIPSRIEPATG